MTPPISARVSPSRRGAWRPAVLARLALLALACLTPAGCFYIGGTSRAGPSFPMSTVDRIQPGVSTRFDVLDILGPPTEFERPELAASVLDEEMRFAADLLEVSRRARKIYTWQRDDWDMGGTILLLYNGIFVDARTDIVVVFFDDDDIVMDVAVTQLIPEDS
jgi:hypothetical protein